MYIDILQYKSITIYIFYPLILKSAYIVHNIGVIGIPNTYTALKKNKIKFSGNTKVKEPRHTPDVILFMTLY